MSSKLSKRAAFSGPFSSQKFLMSDLRPQKSFISLNSRASILFNSRPVNNELIYLAHSLLIIMTCYEQGMKDNIR